MRPRERVSREEDVAAAYNTVRTEMEAYGHGLDEKPEIVALSQCDTVDDEERAEKARTLEAACGQRPVELSAATRLGVEEVLRALMATIEDARAADAPPVVDTRWRD